MLRIFIVAVVCYMIGFIIGQITNFAGVWFALKAIGGALLAFIAAYGLSVYVGEKIFDSWQLTTLFYLGLVNLFLGAGIITGNINSPYDEAALDVSRSK